MKTIVTMLSVLLILSATTASAGGPKLSVGLYGGMNFPITEDNQGGGTEIGFRGRFGLLSIVVIEPYVTSIKWGYVGSVGAGEEKGEGFEVTSYGVEASFGNFPGTLGLSPYFFGGIGKYRVKRDVDSYESSALGYSAGLGVGLGLSRQIALDVRGKLMLAPQEEDGSKKAVAILAGINYNFGMGL